MRRPRRRAFAVAALACLAGPVHASPTALTLEGGAEGDTNIQRVETGEGLDTDRIGGPVLRFGGRLDHRGRLRGGAGVLALGALTRQVVGNDVASPENVALLTADVRWVHAIGARPVAAGIGLVAADALPLAHETGARTFRNLGVDGLLVFRGGERGALSLGVGPRRFVYKPDRDFDYTALALNARLDLTLWAPADGTRSIELAAIASFEARGYDSLARRNACPDGAAPELACFAPTSLARRDRYQRAGVELTWVGGVVAAAGYQLSVDDSNSFGQSFVRHRATLSATTDLPGALFGTVLATLQLDHYPDGLIVERDLQQQELTSLDDANHSSLQVRLARKLNAAWSVEGRAAIWRDLGGTLDLAYRRELVYLGVVYAR